MAKTKAPYILGACFLTASAAILTLVALGTENWVESDAELVSVSDELSYINYGLFVGVLEQNYGSKTYYKLQSKWLHVLWWCFSDVIFFVATCLFSENICALLCGNTGDERTADLENLFKKENVSFNTNCPKVNRLLNVELPIPAGRAARATTCGFCMVFNKSTFVKRFFFRYLSIYKCRCVGINDNFLDSVCGFWSFCCWTIRLEYCSESCGSLV